MSESGPPQQPPTSDGPDPIGLRFTLAEAGLLHPPLPDGGREGFTAYADMLHLWCSGRELRISTPRGVLRISQRLFPRREGLLALFAELRRRVAALPDGPARIEAMGALDRRLTAAGLPWLGPVVALACGAVYALQRHWPGLLLQEAAFNADLVRIGELWRIPLANFLHAGWVHLGLNAFALVVLGILVERPLGHGRTAFVMGASGLAAMLGCQVAGYQEAIGASGITAGLVAALAVLEWLRPALIPAPWRIPRRLFLLAVGAEVVLLPLVPDVAHAAHIGGALEGGLVAWLVAPRRGSALRPLSWVRVGNALILAALVASAVVAGLDVAHPAQAMARRADRLLARSDSSPVILNNEAWMIAISKSPGPHLLDLAEQMALRAVRATDRQDPSLLDTLAEVYFAKGERRKAVETIDEAILLAPHEDYFREQRRRFTGERPPESRPPPPGQEPFPAPQPEPEGEPAQPGVRV